jgi:hypothetical protein
MSLRLQRRFSHTLLLLQQALHCRIIVPCNRLDATTKGSFVKNKSLIAITAPKNEDNSKELLGRQTTTEQMLHHSPSSFFLCTRSFPLSYRLIASHQLLPGKYFRNTGALQTLLNNYWLLAAGRPQGGRREGRSTKIIFLEKNKH